jgi:16S rRNA (guanine(966)-N(2))-methyltransferase RsmD
MSGMRVIGGSAKGRRLRMVPGEGTRPVSDRVKVSLFDILGADLQGAWFLDLFAGTGGVAIEALSRGAAGALLVDKDPRASATIRANLLATGLDGRAEVLRADAFELLERRPHRAFDYVYVAPPQYLDLWARAVMGLDTHTGWLNPDAWVIIQVHPKELHEIPLARLRECDRRKYGSTLLVFFELPGT